MAAQSRIIRFSIGSGGMGAVYLAQDTELDRRVALKILPPEVSSDPDRLRRFVQEAKTASALNHPNVATIQEIREADGVHFIAMEYVDGQTLSARISGRALTAAEIPEIAIPVADALDAAHARGITHRDIKPGNIMINARGQVKLLDFGLAKVAAAVPSSSISIGDMPTAAKTELGVVMGTVQYMSPEQGFGRGVDHRSDTSPWASSCTVTFCLPG